MSLIPIKLLCNRRPKSSSGSGSGSSSSSGSGTTTNSAALPDWFYFNTEENSVHCKYPLVGDSEVSAFGYGSSSGGGGGGGGSDLKWGRDPEEDDREWARRCLAMARKMMMPASGKKKKM